MLFWGKMKRMAYHPPSSLYNMVHELKWVQKSDSNVIPTL